MLPKFPESAFIQVEVGVPFDQLKAGDTVVFWDYKRGEVAMTHHRLIQKQGGNWIAQGDNNDFADQSWITPDNYLARSTGVWVKSLTTP